jgi:hypothetical protein
VTKYEKVKSVNGKELFVRFLEECKNKRVGILEEGASGRDGDCKFTRYGNTGGTILKFKYIEWEKAALNGEKSRLNGE